MDIKFLRKKYDLSQQRLSDLTGIPKGRINGWEQQGTKPKKEDADKLEEIFSKLENNPDFDIPEIERIRLAKISGGQRGLITVPIPAQANYAKHFTDPVYLDKLERTFIPWNPYDSDRYRFFQVEGDSMEYVDNGRSSGIPDGSWIIAERVDKEDWQYNLRKFYVYVVVTDTRITIKRILQDNPNEIVLHADNELYGQERIPLSEVKEIWMFKRKLDWNDPPPRKIEIKV